MLREMRQGRKAFTQGIVARLRQAYPQYNWICVHTAHSKSFEGVAGEDYGQGHGDFDIKLGGVVGYAPLNPPPRLFADSAARRYEIYYCRGGVFALHGDGGFQNVCCFK